MRKIIFFLLVTFSAVTLIAQEGVTIEPSGNIVTKDVNVRPFDVIQASGLYELVLTEGGKEAVRIEADDNLQRLFVVSNNGNKLVIETPELKNQNINFKNKKDRQSLKWKVYVTYKKVKSLDLAVVGNVRSETVLKADDFEIESKTVGNIDIRLNTNKLSVKNNGVGNLTLSGTANDATVANKGVGRFDGEELVVQTMDIDNSGVGSADVNVEKNLQINDSFLGKVRNKGNAKRSKTDGVVI